MLQRCPLAPPKNLIHRTFLIKHHPNMPFKFKGKKNKSEQSFSWQEHGTYTHWYQLSHLAKMQRFRPVLLRSLTPWLDMSEHLMGSGKQFGIKRFFEWNEAFLLQCRGRTSQREVPRQTSAYRRECRPECYTLLPHCKPSSQSHCSGPRNLERKKKWKENCLKKQKEKEKRTAL